MKNLLWFNLFIGVINAFTFVACFAIGHYWWGALNLFAAIWNMVVAIKELRKQ